MQGEVGRAPGRTCGAGAESARPGRRGAGLLSAESRSSDPRGAAGPMRRRGSEPRRGAAVENGGGRCGGGASTAAPHPTGGEERAGHLREHGWPSLSTLSASRAQRRHPRSPTNLSGSDGWRCLAAPRKPPLPHQMRAAGLWHRRGGPATASRPEARTPARTSDRGPAETAEPCEFAAPRPLVASGGGELPPVVNGEGVR